MITLYIFILILSADACKKQHMRSIIRGNYQNVLEYSEGPIISSRKQNSFGGGFDNGIMFRDSIYAITGSSGFSFCQPGYSLVIQLMQPYELNTFVFWLYDITTVGRTYNIIVYMKYQDNETIILDTTAIKNIVKIKFQDQLVTSFRIYNRGGNTENTGVYIIKAEAYYTFDNIDR